MTVTVTDYWDEREVIPYCGRSVYAGGILVYADTRYSAWVACPLTVSGNYVTKSSNEGSLVPTGTAVKPRMAVDNYDAAVFLWGVSSAGYRVELQNTTKDVDASGGGGYTLHTASEGIPDGHGRQLVYDASTDSFVAVYVKKPTSFCSLVARVAEVTGDFTMTYGSEVEIKPGLSTLSDSVQLIQLRSGKYLVVYSGGCKTFTISGASITLDAETSHSITNDAEIFIALYEPYDRKVLIYNTTYYQILDIAEDGTISAVGSAYALNASHSLFKMRLSGYKAGVGFFGSRFYDYLLPSDPSGFAIVQYNAGTTGELDYHFSTGGGPAYDYGVYLAPNGSFLAISPWGDPETNTAYRFDVTGYPPLPIYGTGETVFPLPASVATGRNLGLVGIGRSNFPRVKSGGSGTNPVIGHGRCVFPKIKSHGYGGGAGRCVFPVPVSHGTGMSEIIGEGHQRFPRSIAKGHGTVSIVGTGRCKFPLPVFRGVESDQISGDGYCVFPKVRGGGSGSIEITGSGHCVFPLFVSCGRSSPDFIEETFEYDSETLPAGLSSTLTEIAEDTLRYGA